ncbi:hypothetical protein T06_11460 [Trichinella sp. T6]|nr:hypothetical protein T06_11460 [Trichinella sp. T6]
MRYRKLLRPHNNGLHKYTSYVVACSSFCALLPTSRRPAAGRGIHSGSRNVPPTVAFRYLSSLRGTCFSPASSGLRTGCPSKTQVWSSSGLASKHGRPVCTQVHGLSGLSRTSGAPALSQPFPVLSRRAAPGLAAAAVCTLLPTVLACLSGGRTPGQPVAGALC